MQDAKEEVRSRLNIEDVIGEYVQLKRAGRNWRGLSPFTGEKTPSFYVSPDKQIWHDFSGSKGGDVFSFIMEVEGVDFRGAMELLARKAGVDLSQYQTAGDRGIAKKKQRMLSALDLAATYYQHSLLKNPHALEYVFKKRKLSKQVVQLFRIGYSPMADDGLLKALIKRGFTQDELKNAGLIVQRRGQFTDMFRGRMMVPLCDGQGQVVGFTARQLVEQQGSPKYINTPGTILYDKSRQVFGLHLAKEAIRKADVGIIVEGNLDVVSSHQAGVSNVVAAAGTALTEYHLKSISRLTENAALAFDSDVAGIAATERAIELAQKAGVRLTVINLPDDAKDPDELIQKDPAAWQAAAKSSQPVVEWVIDRYKSMYDLTTADGKRQLTTRALGIVQKLDDPIEQEHYIRMLAEVTGASEGALKEKMTNIEAKAVQPRKLKQVAKTEAPSPDSYIYQDGLLALAIGDPDTRDALRHLKTKDLEGEARQAVLEYLHANPTRQITESVPKELHEHDTYVKILLLQSETRYGQWSAEDRYHEAARLVRQVQTQKTKSKKARLTQDLREAEASGDIERVQTLRAKLNAIIKEQ
jgi:DNA primase